ncbi:Serine/threonine protein phosphatase 2A 57 kDa regulatory subunit B' beta isoform, partial [Reticulomyxa filosa]
KFLLRLINLFNSEDPRERECLKMILHRIYGRCMPVRFFVRNAINNVLFLVIHENRRHNGIAELLDILGSIINGFALPLKSEHVCFLQQVLVPLHKTPTLSQFHLQLNYCVTQFILKDPTLAGCVLSGILKYWPVTSCQKELLFLEELEGVLALADPTLIEKVVEPLFKRVSNAISSHHFQVAEKALFLWNNDTIASFTSNHKDRILPIIFPALQQNYSTHWNSTVSSLTLNIIRIFKEMDKELYEGVSKEFKTQSGNRSNQEQRRAERWKKLRERTVMA